MTEQWTLPLEIREFRPEDYQRLAELYESIFPDYARTQGEWRFEDDSLDRSKYYFKRYTCLKADTRQTVGFGQCSHASWMFHPRKFWLDVWVDPQHQRKGLGTAIYSRLSSDLQELGAVKAWAGVREDMPGPVGFARSRGFRERMRAWESRLDPFKVNTSEFNTYIEQASRQGIRVSTLAAEKNEEPECYRKLYELVQATAADIPRPEKFTPSSYEQWEAWEVKNPNLVPEGYMIAKDSERYVGMSTVWRSQKEPRGLYQGLTGVLKEYRGCGIAMALKLNVIEFARRSGYERIKTWNDSTNAPMLAINQKLGFKRQVGWITFEKNLI